MGVRPCGDYVVGRKGSGRGTRRGRGEARHRKEVEGTVKYSKTRCISEWTRGERGIRFTNIHRINYNWNIPYLRRPELNFFLIFPNILDEWGQRGSVTLRRAQ